jgi:hypothetical protein
MFFRQSLLGFDSYASWACVTNGWCETLAWQQGFVIFLELIPPIIILAKLVMILSLFFSLLACFFIVRLLFDERKAWIALFCGVPLLPIVFFEFAKFENELFAVPLIFWGLYFLLLKGWKKLVGIGLWAVSLFFWLWAGIFFVNSWGNQFPLIVEQQFFVGLLPLFFGVIFLMFVLLVKNNFLRVLFLFFLFGGLVSGKLALLLVPFCLIGLAQLLELLDEKDYNYNFLIVVPVILFIGFNYAVFVGVPTPNEWQIVDVGVELAKNENIPIYNDWSFGYWLWNKGIKTKNHNGTGFDTNYLDFNKPFVALTAEDMGYILGCEKVKDFSSSTRSISVWKCN